MKKPNVRKGLKKFAKIDQVDLGKVGNVANVNLDEMANDAIAKANEKVEGAISD